MWELLTPSTIRLLLLLGSMEGYEGFRSLKSKLKWSQAKLLTALRNLEDLKLIEVETLKRVPPTNVYRLTDKGRRVYELLKKLNELLET
ncbi:winged helix-turn-helix transcriptional regulator [Candidatus Bathyarchaeota archaeon]|nr:winged helix-turn-helix transcriptional regulator [Candidatus Bathyarchaeota archaeon]